MHMCIFATYELDHVSKGVAQIFCTCALLCLLVCTCTVDSIAIAIGREASKAVCGKVELVQVCCRMPSLALRFIFRFEWKRRMHAVDDTAMAL